MRVVSHVCTRVLLREVERHMCAMMVSGRWHRAHRYWTLLHIQTTAFDHLSTIMELDDVR